MRFNQKELAFIALQPAETFDLQGLLWLKEKDGHFWQRTECECRSSVYSWEPFYVLFLM
jgi:hypothetical protein